MLVAHTNKFNKIPKTIFILLDRKRERERERNKEEKKTGRGMSIKCLTSAR